VWSGATYGCASWTLKKDESLDAFEMQQILRIPWSDYMDRQKDKKMTMYWKQQEQKRSLFVQTKQWKLYYFGHILRKKWKLS